MNHRRDGEWSRREFLSTAALARTAVALGLRSESVAADPPRDWPAERQVEYFDWAFRVCRGLAGVNARLDEAFTRVHTEGLERVRGR